MYIDVDEFITTKRNNQLKIVDELRTTYKNTDCIMVPWIMMSPVNRENPKCLLQTNIYRINYDNKPIHNCSTRGSHGDEKFTKHSSGRGIQTKSIFKCSKFNAIHRKNIPSDHHPWFPTSKVLHCVESVYNTKVQYLFTRIS